MEDSILTGTKKILGISEDYTVFDVDILTHINSIFSILQELGVGPAEGFFIEDSEALWSDFISSISGINMVRSYMYLRVRMLFDPPPTSFAIEAMNNQIKEFEWRLNTIREWNNNPVDPAA